MKTFLEFHHFVVWEFLNCSFSIIQFSQIDISKIHDNSVSKEQSLKMEEQIKLLNGFYKVDGHFLPLWRIDGNKLYMKDGWDILSSFFSDCSVEYGEFGKYFN